MNTLKDNFIIPQGVYGMADKLGIPMQFVDDQLPEFQFYWTEGKGKGTRRKSWPQTYWNWVKNAWSWKLKKDKETRNTPLIQNTEYESLPEVKLSSKESAKEAIEQMKRKSGLRCRST